MVKALGGGLWAALLALSVVVTVALPFGLGAFVDTSAPPVMLLMMAVAFSMGFANGWKQRGVSDEEEARERDEEARAAESKALAVRIEQLPLGEKLHVKTAYLGKSNRMEGKSADLFYRHSAEQLEGIAYAVPMQCGEVELKLTEAARKAVDVNPWCLDAVPWPKE